MSKPVNKVTTETGAVSDNVRHSIPTGSGAGDKAGSLELAMALESSQETILAKDQEIAALRAQLAEKDRNTASNDSIAQLANMLKELAAQPTNPVQGPTESGTINKTTDFTNQKFTIDNRSLMEAQAAVSEFRGEAKVPVSIPKVLANTFGPNLSVSVNGVRVSVACDGRTYYINKTHAEHIRERIAKVDIYNAQPGEAVTIKA